MLKTKIENSLPLITVVGIAAAFVLFVHSVTMVLADNDFNRDAFTCPATVEKIAVHQQMPHTARIPDTVYVTYKIDGTEYTESLRDFDHSVYGGKKLMISVSEKDPHIIRAKKDPRITDNLVFGLLCLFISVVCGYIIIKKNHIDED